MEQILSDIRQIIEDTRSRVQWHSLTIPIANIMYSQLEEQLVAEVKKELARFLPENAEEE